MANIYINCVFFMVDLLTVLSGAGIELSFFLFVMAFLLSNIKQCAKKVGWKRPRFTSGGLIIIEIISYDGILFTFVSRVQLCELEFFHWIAIYEHLPTMISEHLDAHNHIHTHEHIRKRSHTLWNVHLGEPAIVLGEWRLARGAQIGGNGTLHSRNLPSCIYIEWSM